MDRIILLHYSLAVDCLYSNPDANKIRPGKERAATGNAYGYGLDTRGPNYNSRGGDMDNDQKKYHVLNYVEFVRWFSPILWHVDKEATTIDL